MGKQNKEGNYAPNPFVSLLTKLILDAEKGGEENAMKVTDRKKK